jgi:hypothetical protein
MVTQMRTPLACGLMLATLQISSGADELRIDSGAVSHVSTPHDAAQQGVTVSGGKGVSTAATGTRTVPLSSLKFTTEPIVEAHRGLERPQLLDRPGSRNTELEPAAGPTIFTAVFNSSAHFALQDASTHGRLANTLPVVIYEDMTITVNPATGDFEVRFVAEVPLTSVVMNLQFEVEGLDAPRTITLTPIVFPCDRSQQNQQAIAGSNTWQVRRTGSSQILKRAAQGGLDQFSLSRRGTVSIGDQHSHDSLY